MKTTLLLNVCPSTSEVHAATLFECRTESSVFYERQVDDVIVVNNGLNTTQQSQQKEAEKDQKFLSTETNKTSKTESASMASIHGDETGFRSYDNTKG